jgi:lipopolysaccharide transport system ATP-binding protein
VAFAEVEKFIDTPVKHYSSGMYVRLAFSVAAHLEPEILLVDEVLAVGDAEFQKKCMGKMEDISHEGRTVLFVSHNMMAVKNLCTKGIVLSEGKLVCHDDVSKAVEVYLSGHQEFTGEISWDSPETAPGNHQVKLKTVSILSDDLINGSPIHSENIDIQIDYWNLKRDSRRLISIHVFNSMGMLLFATSNLKSVSLSYDPWCYQNYSTGLFRTTCTIPGNLLNCGQHSVSIYINGRMADNILAQKHIISFDVKESDEMRSEYTGEWPGAIRPKLAWKTIKID